MGIWREGGTWWRSGLIGASIIVISVLHYATATHLAGVHEGLKRLYYVPIVAAAVQHGSRAGLGTSVLASALYLPFIAGWAGSGAIGWSLYGEVVLLNVVAVVTGTLADRLREERNRYRAAVVQLEAVYADAQVRAERELQLDRLATVGRLAAGLADELRNPLGALVGCLEILAGDVPPAHPHAEFYRIAQNEMRRLDRVVAGVQEFAHPPQPCASRLDVRDLVGAALCLVRPGWAGRAIVLGFRIPSEPIVVRADRDQVQRAIVNILLETTARVRKGQVSVTVERRQSCAGISLEIERDDAVPMNPAGLFEPFSAGAPCDGLTLAIARRLLENQGGTVRAEGTARGLRCVIELGLATEADALTQPLTGGLMASA